MHALVSLHALCMISQYHLRQHTVGTVSVMVHNQHKGLQQYSIDEQRGPGAPAVQVVLSLTVQQQPLP